MGKKKMNSVFKVAGAKSLKLKAKAKSVKANLKHLTSKNKEKIVQLDKQFVQMQGKSVIVTKEGKKDNHAKLPGSGGKATEETQQRSQEALKNLNEMKL